MEYERRGKLMRIIKTIENVDFFVLGDWDVDDENINMKLSQNTEL